MRRAYRRRGQSILAGATLACVAACAVGVPLPAIVFKAIAERFPCELHPCGCVDAEACWRDCCCMTHAEKLAWAERQGVKVPAYVIAEAARQLIANTEEAAGAEAKAACCAAKASCCATTKALADSSCCHEPTIDQSTAGSCCQTKGTCERPAARSDGFRFLVLHEAMKCRGLTVTVALLPPSLPVEMGDTAPPPLVIHAVPCMAENLYQSPDLAIDAPPPDAARA
jgi:hypothetical protein